MGNTTYKPVVNQEPEIEIINFNNCLPSEKAVIAEIFINVIKNYEFDFTDLTNQKLFIMYPMNDMRKDASIEDCSWGGVRYISNETRNINIDLYPLLCYTMKEIDSVIHEKIQALNVPHVYSIELNGNSTLKVHVQLVHGLRA